MTDSLNDSSADGVRPRARSTDWDPKAIVVRTRPSGQPGFWLIRRPPTDRQGDRKDFALVLGEARIRPLLIGARRDGVSCSEPCGVSRQGSGKTAQSGALRGGLIEGHTGGRQIRMPIVRNWEGRCTRTAATSRQGQSGAPFFRLTEPARSTRCRPSGSTQL
jgi:hypothetical protein